MLVIEPARLKLLRGKLGPFRLHATMKYPIDEDELETVMNRLYPLLESQQDEEEEAPEPAPPPPPPRASASRAAAAGRTGECCRVGAQGSETCTTSGTCEGKLSPRAEWESSRRSRERRTNRSRGQACAGQVSATRLADPQRPRASEAPVG